MYSVNLSEELKNQKKINRIFVARRKINEKNTQGRDAVPLTYKKKKKTDLFLTRAADS